MGEAELQCTGESLQVSQDRRGVHRASPDRRGRWPVLATGHQGLSLMQEKRTELPAVSTTFPHAKSLMGRQHHHRSAVRSANRKVQCPQCDDCLGLGDAYLAAGSACWSIDASVTRDSPNKQEHLCPMLHFDALDNSQVQTSGTRLMHWPCLRRHRNKDRSPPKIAGMQTRLGRGPADEALEMLQRSLANWSCAICNPVERDWP
jgi:hypothetical protein|mmetsp:Transcript_47743/g.78655  ORF Transcript_47743/g.78655 Transcript_47743/m.78655 type:complete len:204 (+) Transcript_47743:784-1395(+)